MFPTPSQVLRQREGVLADTPFPLLLHALMAEERTCTLELKVRQREKRIVFEDGAPVACQSNLLHETLGKYLVEKGKLSETDYQKALAESISAEVPLSGLLVQKGLISPFDLYKQLQANLAHKLLDCFRWVDAKYRLIADVEPPDASVRTNTGQLILTGVANVMPFDAVATHFTFTDERRFGQMPGTEAGLKLSSKDARLFQALRLRPTFGELMERTGFDTEVVLRRLYALCLLEVAGFVEDVDAKAARLSAGKGTAPAAPAPEPVAPPVAAPAPQGTPFSDEDEAARNALVSAFMSHRSKDPFALLDVPEDVQPVPLRKAFLALADRYAPLRFHTPELREKAEVLLAAHAKAFGALSDAEQNLLWRKRRAAHREKDRGTRPTTAEQFPHPHGLAGCDDAVRRGEIPAGRAEPRGGLRVLRVRLRHRPEAAVPGLPGLRALSDEAGGARTAGAAGVAGGVAPGAHAGGGLGLPGRSGPGRRPVGAGRRRVSQGVQAEPEEPPLRRTHPGDCPAALGKPLPGCLPDRVCLVLGLGPFPAPVGGVCLASDSGCHYLRAGRGLGFPFCGGR